MYAVNLHEKFAKFSDYCNPRLIGEVNDCAVKAVKLKGEFIWHHHDNEDELFLVVKGTLRMSFAVMNPSFTKASSSSFLAASNTYPLPIKKSTFC
jgi:mannose-6-phosphate isomerase-like protein (cupin superfamily)